MLAALVLVMAAAATLGAPTGTAEPDVILVPGDYLDVEVAAGERLQLRCQGGGQAGGQGGEVTWWLNGQRMVNSSRVRVGRQRLKWRAVKRRDAGEYGCLTRGGLWANASLVVLGASQRDRLAQGLAAVAPSALSAHRDDFPLQDIHDVPQADGHDADEGRGDALNSVQLQEQTTPAPPAAAVSSPTHTQVRREGDAALLPCPVAGPSTSPPFWLKDGQPFELRAMKDRAAAQGTFLSIKALGVDDSGNYTCTVANQHGSDASSVLLRVFSRAEDIPLVLRAPRNASEPMGGTASFECEPSPDAPESSRVSWVHLPPGMDVGAALNDTVMASRAAKPRGGTPGAFPRLLVLEELRASDEGWYVCVVHSGQGKGRASASAWLHVMPAASPEDGAEAGVEAGDEAPPRCRGNATQGQASDRLPQEAPRFVRPVAMTGYDAKPAGNMVRLRCPATANPCPNVTWTKDGGPIQRLWGQVRYGEWSVLIEELVTDDSGNYTCNVCNALGCVNFTTKVEVIERMNHRPIITKMPENTTVVVGREAHFSCVILSDLHPSLFWVRGNFSVCGENCPRVQSGDYSESGPTDPESLRLTNVTHEDEGYYTCVAGNTLGITYALAYLRVVDTEEEQRVPVPRTPPSLVVSLLAAGLCTMFLVGVFIMVIIFRSLKREKLKKLKAIETARAAVVTHWTKKVIVEPAHRGSAMGLNVSESPSPSQEPLLMPLVKIQKQKCSAPADSLTISEYELPVDPDWEFPRSSLGLGKSLGEGAFGKVVRAEARGILKQGVETTVAVKMLKEGHTDAEMMDLVSEMEMMKMIGRHVNIINLLGCCTQGGPLFVVVEYAPHGNLRDFLRQQRPASGGASSSGYERAIGNKALTHKDLVSFAYQVARGMEYLASRRCIHRDLAARNVLVSDDYVIKIADFGLARDIHCNDYYRKTTNSRIPVKWMAPEALFHRVYTTQSDVWSYGILLWEIMTLGGTPYPSMPSVENLFQMLRSGHRMEKPPACSLEMYMLMRECWSYQPNERPTFEELVEELDQILTVTANEEYLNLGMPSLVTPPSSEDEDEDEENELDLFPALL